MYLIKWFNCKYRNIHSMKIMFKNSPTPRCEVCFKSQKRIDNREYYDIILKRIKQK